MHFLADLADEGCDFVPRAEVDVVKRLGDALRRSFGVVEPGRVRVSALARPDGS